MTFVPKLRTVPHVPGSFTTGARRNLGGLANFKVPPIHNEPNVCPDWSQFKDLRFLTLVASHHTPKAQSSAQNSKMRWTSSKATFLFKCRSSLAPKRFVTRNKIYRSSKLTFYQISSNLNKSQGNPSDHASAIANYREASAEQVNEAIENALKAKPEWENMSFANRAAIFLRAAELVATKYRYDIMAATMLGQGKNIWQAEIDAAAETADFYRFNVHYASELYKQQNTMNDTGMWK